MLERSQLKSMFPLFATPCYGGVVTQAFCNSVVALEHACSELGISHAFNIGGGDSLVTRARNTMVAEFLAAEDLTHLMWIDADIGFDAESVFRLLLSDFDVAAGVYPLKRHDWPEAGLPKGMTREEFEYAYSGFPVATPPGAVPIDPDGFMEAYYAPTGFMLIKRDVLVKMMGFYPELRYNPGKIFGQETSEEHLPFFYRFFDVLAEPDNGEYLSEDYAFCKRWADMGGKVHIDVNTPLTHQGIFAYKGTLGKSAWLKKV